MRKRSEPHTFGQQLDAHRLRLEHELSRLSDSIERDAVAARLEQLQIAAAMYEFLMPRNETATSH